MVTKKELLALLRGAKGEDFDIVCDTLLKCASEEDLDAVCGELRARARIIARITGQLHYWDMKILKNLQESTVPDLDDEEVGELLDPSGGDAGEGQQQKAEVIQS
ncbi:MAG: hypothetical protein JXA69_08625 [Phycisphaerae bacterium]|nr:hypothetical protein [Phycisphaerae bacterium]